MSEKRKKKLEIGQVIHIDKPIKPIEFKPNKDFKDMVDTLTQKWLCDYVKSWNEFCYDKMYAFYKELELDKVLVLSEQDFRKMIVQRTEELKTLRECINLLKQEGKDTKQQALEKLEELVK